MLVENVFAYQSFNASVKIIVIIVNVGVFAMFSDQYIHGESQKRAICFRLQLWCLSSDFCISGNRNNE